MLACRRTRGGCDEPELLNVIKLNMCLSHCSCSISTLYSQKAISTIWLQHAIARSSHCCRHIGARRGGIECVDISAFEAAICRYRGRLLVFRHRCSRHISTKGRSWNKMTKIRDNICRGCRSVDRNAALHANRTGACAVVEVIRNERLLRKSIRNKKERNKERHC